MAVVTTTELYEAIQHVGAARAAAQGYFHNLPGGGGGSSNVKMYSTRGSSWFSQTSRALFNVSTLGLTVAPFMNVTVLTPKDGFNYKVESVTIDESMSFIEVIVKPDWLDEGLPPENSWDVEIGLRVEPFVAS